MIRMDVTRGLIKNSFFARVIYWIPAFAGMVEAPSSGFAGRAGELLPDWMPCQSIPDYSWPRVRADATGEITVDCPAEIGAGAPHSSGRMTAGRVCAG